MKKQIMVVEDEVDIRLFMMTALEDNGFDTVEFVEGSSIEEVFEKNKPDLVVMDFMMPRRSGISICKEIRSTPDYDDIPIILVSGMMADKEPANQEIKRMFEEYSIPFPEGFIEKPVQIPELVEMIGSLLGEEDNGTADR